MEFYSFVAEELAGTGGISVGEIKIILIAPSGGTGETTFLPDRRIPITTIINTPMLTRIVTAATVFVRSSIHLSYYERVLLCQRYQPLLNVFLFPSSECASRIIATPIKCFSIPCFFNHNISTTFGAFHINGF